MGVSVHEKVIKIERIKPKYFEKSNWKKFSNLHAGLSSNVATFKMKNSKEHLLFGKHIYKVGFHKPKDDVHPEAFTAVLTTTSEAGRIKFDDVRTNVGLSYDKRSGFFTARKKGIYSFYWTAVSALRFVKTELFVGSLVRSVAVSDLLPDLQVALDEVTNWATLSLKPGDKVFVMSNNTIQPGSVFSGNRVYQTKYPTAFFARSVDQTVDGTGPTQFQDIVLNTNGDFDGTTFTAPSDGLYVFTASASTIFQSIQMDLDQNENSLFVPDEASPFLDAFVKSVSILQLERQSNDRINTEINGFAFIDDRTIFSGYNHLDGKSTISAIPVAVFNNINFDCSLGCIAFSDNPRVFLDVKNDFNVKKGEFTALRRGVYGIAVSIESLNIASNYSIEISNVEMFTGSANGPIPVTTACYFSKRVVFQYLHVGDVVRVTVRGTYGSGSSLSIWKLYD